METNSHQSEERLELLALGRLPEFEVVEIEEHLLICGVCREKLDQAADYAFAMRDELRLNPVAAKKPVFGWSGWSIPRFAFAGGFAAALLAVVLFGIRHDGSNLAPLASLQLTAMRGEMPTVDAARELDLRVTDAPADSGPFRLEVVNAGGKSVWNASPQPIPAGLEAKITQALPQGDYFVRLYGGGGTLLHEYGFHLKR